MRGCFARNPCKRDGGTSTAHRCVVRRVKAISYSRTGDSSVLRLHDREVPEPGTGEVRVRVVLSGVNPTDWKRRVGSGPGQELEFPEIVPNQDGAGVVDATGAGVADVSVGDRVWMFMAQYERPTGTAQEYVVLPATHVVRLPDDASFEVGASLGVPALTAHRALTVAEDWPSRLQPGALAGATVLVAGGAGAVGHAAIQLARWAGARVITTVSSAEKGALATAAGAHHVVNYKSEDAAVTIRDIAPDGVDIVVEVAPAQNAALDAAVVGNRASVAIYANNGGDSVALPIRPSMMTNTRYQFLILYTVGDEALRHARDDVSGAVGAGALDVGEAAGLPLHYFPLEDTAAAHDAVESGVTGKVLIRVSD
jgi:NADPH:quinone reductase